MSEMSAPSHLEKIAEGKARKDEGNEFFKTGDYVKAMTKYHEAILFLSGLSGGEGMLPGISTGQKPLGENEKLEVQKTLAICYSNMAACHIKNQRWERATMYADKALTADPSNVKARFRRAQSLLNQGNLNRAEEDLKKLLADSPKDPLVRREYEILKQRYKEQDERQRKEFAGMFDKMK
ncbi:TPR-like protein [Basidiobolus meristosporus CBS 931.73]|uniref:TPR-like protein n=1 Tax=Basidiobolus meristosporus CBS 931.73 TaxID=1314790 RepID=A0A1Y1XP54_9FUNG|nr:TPR-like protein [Basidiobolus meristosporus CBS 931.73]|eukprot:ORX87528.1 TPR-like protein [Basidiobolus meristosporus CBS 931.73]